MAGLNAFDCFVQDVARKVHNLHSDSLYLLLTKDEPDRADESVDTTLSQCVVKPFSNAVEVLDGNGYTKGGNVTPLSSDGQVAGVYKLVLTSPDMWTCIDAPTGPFRYAVLYNASAGVPAARPVIGWADYGSLITLNVGETFAATLDQVNGTIKLRSA